MARTRAAVLAGALRGVEKYGTKRTTMGDIATLGGVAKATVYNHFRAKTDVYAALVESEVRALGEECVERAEAPGDRDPLAVALEHAAASLSESRALRRLATEEPQVAARLTTLDDGAASTAARDAALGVLAAAGRDADPLAAETVLRWLVSHVTWPASRDAARAGADAIAAAPPPSGEPSRPAPPPEPAAVVAEPEDTPEPVAPPEPVAEPGPAATPEPAAPPEPQRRPDVAVQRDLGAQPAAVGSGLGWPG